MPKTLHPSLTIILLFTACGPATEEELATSEEEATSVPTCAGLPATLVIREGGCAFGTSGPDVIVATGFQHNIIFAGGGNDVVCARGGDDIVFGGGGNDRLFGQGGKDILLGEGGNDRLNLGGNDGVWDVADGGAGADSVVAFVRPPDVCSPESETDCVFQTLEEFIIFHVAINGFAVPARQDCGG